MVNYNGNLLTRNTDYLNHTNRGLRYGDALFESIRTINGNLLFWEDHYLRLMASMRILRMEIPMDFTMEFLEKEIMNTLESDGLLGSAARIRFTVFRQDGGLYLPKSNEISYIIESSSMDFPFYTIKKGPYLVDLFKDFLVNPDMLSTLKTNNRIINVVGSIFAKENDYDNCLLLNRNKHVVEALNANLFLVSGNRLVTPPKQDGCVNGIIRKKIIEILNKLENYDIEERSISPFELQKADELFLTNAITGIRPITKYRKKEYETKVATDLLGKLNAVARLG